MLYLRSPKNQNTYQKHRHLRVSFLICVGTSKRDTTSKYTYKKDAAAA